MFVKTIQWYNLLEWKLNVCMIIEVAWKCFRHIFTFAHCFLLIWLKMYEPTNWISLEEILDKNL